VLANYGLEGLRFVKPVYVGDTIQVRLTCKSKAAKDDREGQVPQGVVAWDVEVSNQHGEPVAVYTVLTLVKRLYPLGGAPVTEAAVAGALADQAPDAVRAPEVTVTEQPGTAPARMS
jgi:oxepin-CoA hydrolase/3-oxo-5,6-dehydrosuberyl-CoA semialdehyde dehydrogenase